MKDANYEEKFTKARLNIINTERHEKEKRKDDDHREYQLKPTDQLVLLSRVPVPFPSNRYGYCNGIRHGHGAAFCPEFLASPMQKVSTLITSHLPDYISNRPSPTNSIEIPVQLISSHPQSPHSSTFPALHPISSQVPDSSTPHHFPASKEVSKKFPSTLLLPRDPSLQKSVTQSLSEALPVTKASITHMNSTRNKGLLLSFRSDRDREILRKEIEENVLFKEEIHFTAPSKKHPSIILFNIPTSCDELAIQLGLKSSLNIKQDLISIRFKFRGEDPLSQNWVFALPPEILEISQLGKSIIVNWQVYRINEFHHYRRCNFCQSFDHTTKNYKFNIPSCAHCAGHHASNTCTSIYLACINCFNYNVKNGTSFPIEHSSRDKSCKCLQDAIERYKLTIDYS
ncbi:hypothetical protein AVEN_62134-1 [Araneus ventricosus]|uniref:Pre-C2HC domain-containing protein n=1 Tax=Araneus ventricosus TaxID=182803 RepID=A0A4Y2QFQ2_ARAVE|nr:hypothetical protein AVEN_62134-1 [Araneus ventricosus]